MRYQSAAPYTKLLDSLALEKHRMNSAYLMELDDENLLRNYRLEAGLIPFEIELKPGTFLGWEIPSSQLRGHTLGHWMSAAAQTYATDGDERFKARLEYLVGEIARCQEENGDGWCFSIPEKYLQRIRDGKFVWAPHYTCHKTLMGLMDAYRYAGVERALEVARGAAEWFLRYTDGITREHMDEIMDATETGGIMEAWAELYGATRDPRHLELMRRYERPRYYAALLADEGDPLSGKHANSTIPEMLGVCRAYEVTGERRYYDIVQAYWRRAVSNRGTFATGGQTCYEAWTAPHQLACGLGHNTQEHCTVYHMMRLAGFFLRHEGGAGYADYWERNLYNGVFAQGYYKPFYRHSQDWPKYDDFGLISYYLPLRQGSSLYWGSKKNDFWCCHGTLMQANAGVLFSQVYFLSDGEITVSQYLPSELRLRGGEIGQARGISLCQRADAAKAFADTGAVYLQMEVHGGGQEFTLRLRRPTWLTAPMRILLNGQPVRAEEQDGYLLIRREWGEDMLALTLPKGVYTRPLEGQEGAAALCDGPIVLAGLTAVSRALKGDPARILVPNRDRVDGMWNAYWHTAGQPEQVQFTPLFNVGNDTYTVYFDVEPREGRA